MYGLMKDLAAFLRACVDERAAQAASDIDHFDDPGSPSPDPRDIWIVKTARELLADLAAVRLVLDSSDDIPDPWELVPVLKCLAVPYASRPGYLPEWAPERTTP